MKQIIKEEYLKGVEGCKRTFTEFDQFSQEYITLSVDSDSNAYIALTDVSKEGLDEESWDSYTTYYIEDVENLDECFVKMIDNNFGGK